MPKTRKIQISRQDCIDSAAQNAVEAEKNLSKVLTAAPGRDFDKYVTQFNGYLELANFYRKLAKVAIPEPSLEPQDE